MTFGDGRKNAITDLVPGTVICARRMTRMKMSKEELETEVKRLKSALMEVERERAKAIRERDLYFKEYRSLLHELCERVNR